MKNFLSDDIFIFLLIKKYINIKIDITIIIFTVIESKGILKKENNTVTIENKPMVTEQDNNGNFNRLILRCVITIIERPGSVK